MGSTGAGPIGGGSDQRPPGGACAGALSSVALSDPTSSLFQCVYTLPSYIAVCLVRPRKTRCHPHSGPTFQTRTDIGILGNSQQIPGMIRLARLVVPGVLHYITQRWNRQSNYSNDHKRFVSPGPTTPCPLGTRNRDAADEAAGGPRDKTICQYRCDQGHLGSGGIGRPQETFGDLRAGCRRPAACERPMEIRQLGRPQGAGSESPVHANSTVRDVHNLL
jgi:hypothetical protein